MKIKESCAVCLYTHQEEIANKVPDSAKKKAYMTAVQEIIDHRAENDSAPYLVSLFHEKYKEFYGTGGASFAAVKKQYNDFVMSLLPELRKRVASSSDPLKYTLMLARVGNYIDFAAMNEVDDEEFLRLFDEMVFSDNDETSYRAFLNDCDKAESFLLLADNTGEIVLDLLFLEQLHSHFPKLNLTVMVRGEEAMNDVTYEDALYVGLDKIAHVIENGNAVAGTVYNICNDAAKKTIDTADVILSKGQGNYESFPDGIHHAYYSFLCKCEMFTERFKVPRLTGMFFFE